MKPTRYPVLLLFVCLLFEVACTKTHAIRQFHPKETPPRMVYIENEVQQLASPLFLPREREIYVEIRKKDGACEAGRLIGITEQNLILHKGFYYIAVKDSTVKVENEINIPKAEILILKVW